MTEEFKPTPKQKWVIDRLKKRGYHLWKSWGFCMLYYPAPQWAEDCNLKIKIETKTLYYDAHFRLRGDQHIHVNAVLNLQRKAGWRQLDELEAMFRAVNPHSATWIAEAVTRANDADLYQLQEMKDDP